MLVINSFSSSNKKLLTKITFEKAKKDEIKLKFSHINQDVIYKAILPFFAFFQKLMPKKQKYSFRIKKSEREKMFIAKIRKREKSDLFKR